MPNWCNNNLQVYGPKEDVKKFVEENKGIEVGEDFGMAAGEIRELPLSFNAKVTMPEELIGTSSPSDSPNWYDWCIANWGVKWDLNDETNFETSTDGTFAYYDFDTAWSAPELWLEAVGAMYPTLSFKLEYSEPGVGFAGVLGLHKSKVVEQNSWHAQMTSGIEDYDSLYG